MKFVNAMIVIHFTLWSSLGLGQLFQTPNPSDSESPQDQVFKDNHLNQFFHFYHELFDSYAFEPAPPQDPARTSTIRIEKIVLEQETDEDQFQSFLNQYMDQSIGMKHIDGQISRKSKSNIRKHIDNQIENTKNHPYEFVVGATFAELSYRFAFRNKKHELIKGRTESDSETCQFFALIDFENNEALILNICTQTPETLPPAEEAKNETE